MNEIMSDEIISLWGQGVQQLNCTTILQAFLITIN